MTKNQALGVAKKLWGKNGSVNCDEKNKEFSVGVLFTHRLITTFKVNGKGKTWEEAFKNAKNK